MDTQLSRPVERVLLVGFGKLGARLAEVLAAGGTEVFALRRTPTPSSGTVTMIAADASAPLPGRLPVVDSMVVTLPPGPRIDSYRSVLEHISRALPERPERTIFVSSTGVFDGTPPDRIITEHDEPPLTTDRARGLRDGERAAVDLFSAVILRPAGIYGPGRDYLLRRVREQAPVDYRRWTNRIHETDLVRTLELLLRMAEPPLLLHALDEASVPLGDVVTHLAHELSVTAPLDASGGEASGHVLDGRLLHGMLALQYPSYVAGYAEMIGSR